MAKKRTKHEKRVEAAPPWWSPSWSSPRILDVCVEAHGVVTGSLEGGYCLADYLKFLRMVLESWEESTFATCADFDEAVRQVVLATVAELERVVFLEKTTKDREAIRVASEPERLA